LLNRGKASLCLDLKSPDDRRRLEPYFARADILIEQFRPGVMERFGLGFERLRGATAGGRKRGRGLTESQSGS
jgi:crotonobetainyl-CoA:carnitine CoA-transferase CaiB-like acyl-CoA transferase